MNSQRTSFKYREWAEDGKKEWRRVSEARKSTNIYIQRSLIDCVLCGFVSIEHRNVSPFWYIDVYIRHIMLFVLFVLYEIENQTDWEKVGGCFFLAIPSFPSFIIFIIFFFCVLFCRVFVCCVFVYALSVHSFAVYTNTHYILHSCGAYAVWTEPLKPKWTTNKLYIRCKQWANHIHELKRKKQSHYGYDMARRM